jgi:hypothetical protein
VGTVTTVSVTSANGFTGTVATASSTPAITITTSITGLLKGNGTAVSAAAAGTDYQVPITLTTTGSSGAATFSSGTLNIPQYASADTLATVTGRGATTSTAVSITNNTASTSTSSGALVVTGGVGIGGSLNINGALYVASTTDFASGITMGGQTRTTSLRLNWSNAGYISLFSDTGQDLKFQSSIDGSVPVNLVTNGNITTGGTLYGTANTFNISAAPGAATGGNGKNITISSGAAPNTATDAGTITLQGGAGFAGSSTAGNINIIGGDAPVGGLGGSITLTAGTGGAGGFSGKVLIDRTTASSSTTTGALVVNGGVGVAGAIYAGNIYSNGTQLAAGVTAFSGLSDATSAGLTVDELYLQAATRLNVTNNGATAYRFDQYGTADDPTIYATSGSTIAFNLNVSGHPFLIRTSGGSNYNDGLVHVSTTGVVSTGSSAQGQVSGTLYWKIPSSISGAYQYICSIHGGMVGVITINPLVETATSVGLGNVTNESKATMFANPEFTGNVGIGKSSPAAKLHIGVSDASVDGTKGVKITNPAGTTVVLECGVSNDSFVGTTSGSTFSIRSQNIERLKFPNAGGVQAVTTISVGDATPSSSGAGITFPASQSASSDANTLDDYEEGTWTPVITNGSTNVGAYYWQNGIYRKIGNLVWIEAQLSVQTVTIASGNIKITGLPFALAQKTNLGTSSKTIVYGTKYAGSPANAISMVIEASDPSVLIPFLSSDLATQLTYASLTPGGQWHFQGLYVAV